MVQTHRVVSSINTQCVPEFELSHFRPAEPPHYSPKGPFLSEPLDSTYSVRFSKFDRLIIRHPFPLRWLTSLHKHFFGRVSYFALLSSVWDQKEKPSRKLRLGMAQKTALLNIAAAEWFKNQCLRDFWRRRRWNRIRLQAALDRQTRIRHAHNRERSSAFLAANSSDERMPFLCNSASRSILAKRSVSWALSGRYGSLAGAIRGSGVLACAPSTETTGRVETLTVPR